MSMFLNTQEALRSKLTRSLSAFSLSCPSTSCFHQDLGQGMRPKVVAYHCGENQNQCQCFLSQSQIHAVILKPSPISFIRKPHSASPQPMIPAMRLTSDLLWPSLCSCFFILLRGSRKVEQDSISLPSVHLLRENQVQDTHHIYTTIKENRISFTEVVEAAITSTHSSLSRHRPTNREDGYHIFQLPDPLPSDPQCL